MKMIKKKSFIALLAVLLLIVSSVSLSVAYFSDTDTAEGEAALSLSKETKVDEGDNDAKKEINVTNTGTAALVVRVTFFGPDNLKVTGNDNWKLGTDGWYYYYKVLQPGDSTGTPKLTAELNKLSDQELAELGNTLQVTVVQEAEFATYTGDKVDVPSGWGVPEGFSFED